MKKPKVTRLAVLAFTLAAIVGQSACHYARDTAGRPDAEAGAGMDGSVTATKAGTGDPKVGSGRGQVGTDAPARPEAEQSANPGEKGDAKSK